MKITLRQLTYFKALAEQGSFRMAAEVCHVSQPALSVQIQELERHLGGALVERRARKVIVTPLGRDTLQTAGRVLAEMAELESRAKARGGLGGALKLGVIPTIAPYLLPQALAALRASDISLDVQISEAQTDHLLERLERGALDAAVLALPTGHAGLREARLFKDRFLLAGSETRLAELGPVPRPEGLGESQLMLLEDGHCLTDQALAVCGRGRGHARIDMGASSLATLSRLVAAGFGLTLMPEMAVTSETAAVPGLALRRFAEPEPYRTVGLVCRETAAAPWFDRLAQVLGSVAGEMQAR